MRLVVDLCKVLEIEMGIDLGSTKVCMAEQLLNSAQVTARLEQVRGK